MLKEAGKSALLMGGMLDIPFMQHIEMQNPGVHFTRVDAKLAGSSDAENHLFEKLCEYTKDTVKAENTEVKAEKLAGSLPAVLLADEFGRRMEEAQRYYGMPAMGGMLKYTLVLNTASPLIESLNTMEDGSAKENAVKYVYDLARLAYGSLSAEDVTGFIKESAAILEKTLK